MRYIYLINESNPADYILVGVKTSDREAYKYAVQLERTVNDNWRVEVTDRRRL